MLKFDTPKVRVKLVKSLIGRKKNHILCAKGLGLRKIGSVVEVINTPANLGMINKIQYLVSAEGVN